MDSLYRTFKSINQTRKKIPRLRDSNGVIVTQELQINKLLTNFHRKKSEAAYNNSDRTMEEGPDYVLPGFNSLCEKLNTTFDELFEVQTHSPSPITTIREVSSILKKMKNQASPGPTHQSKVLYSFLIKHF